MAYFANGTEGMTLENQCADCIHKNPDVLCPIAGVQLEYNYDQCRDGNEDLRAAMSMLINENGVCQMRKFVVRTE